MNSDSDRTIDSDELQEIIEQSKKRKNSSFVKPNNKKVHTISDSDSDNEVTVEQNKRKFTAIESGDNRPKCQYGKKCYRKNPDHIKNFSHEDADPKLAKKKSTAVEVKAAASDPKSVKKRFSAEVKTAAPGGLDYNFYLTKVHGIPERYNNKLTFDIKDILSLKDGGPLISSAQFNYMFDVRWLMKQYPEEYRKCPLTIVHGEQRTSKSSLEKSGADFSNVKFCQAKLNIPFGTHHTKMMFLLYKNGFRIVIHTSNIVDSDWYQRTQGIWMSPVLPECMNSESGESPTSFKADLLEYINAYEAPELNEWCQIIKKHNFSKVNVFLIGSVPGRHIGSKKTSYGHLKLRKVLNLNGNLREVVQPDWPLIGQFSSIGSLGASPDQWLTGEFSTSLSTTKGSSLISQPAPLKLVYPTENNVRKSLEGYPAGASLPYSYKVATKQPYLKDFLHIWKSEMLGRSEASPHIKTYLRVSPSNAKIAWFLVTSANLSKAAWGALEKKGSQFMIRSYELGVLFLPKYFGKEVFSSPMGNNFSNIFPVPYDIPLQPYSKDDQPWIWDIPHIKAPDRFGNMWCPP
ncbi:tyrosyl-DNA phosphodiesterase 1 [Parasteatoda tepidariorum]|uniref:tyrosyl-DNA phosphodiesterase 1 n=1 Tax=Parasteatoda tepidariorum TaxID=114398 RepID=UPI001C72862E|nr:tyrosyl-DNA phosphodiesterase 1 [Parasteatoda tepidariorum]